MDILIRHQTICKVISLFFLFSSHFQYYQHFVSPRQHFAGVSEKTKKVLFTAAREGKLSVVQAQLEGKLYLINLVDTKDSNNTILHLACEHRHLLVAT